MSQGMTDDRTEAVACALIEYGSGRIPDDCVEYVGKFCRDRAHSFLTALRARGYVVTKEYQE